MFGRIASQTTCAESILKDLSFKNLLSAETSRMRRHVPLGLGCKNTTLWRQATVGATGSMTCLSGSCRISRRWTNFIFTHFECLYYLSFPIIAKLKTADYWNICILRFPTVNLWGAKAVWIGTKSQALLSFKGTIWYHGIFGISAPIFSVNILSVLCLFAVVPCWLWFCFIIILAIGDLACVSTRNSVFM